MKRFIAYIAITLTGLGGSLVVTLGTGKGAMVSTVTGMLLLLICGFLMGYWWSIDNKE